MKVLVIYDSYFSNTEQIANAIAGSFAEQENIKVVKVDAVVEDDLEGLDYLLVGSPTRGFQPSDGTKAFLKTLSGDSLDGVKVAAFDTRISADDIQSGLLRIFVNLAGYAAKPISNRLKKAGGELVMAPEGFYVKGEKGPLKDGELERASQWGKECSST